MKAEKRGSGSNEEFWFNQEWLLKGKAIGEIVAKQNSAVALQHCS